MNREEWLNRQKQWSEIETRLKVELESAQDKFRQSKREFDLARGYALELGLNTVDGTHAIRNASREYNRSLTAYRIALGRFCDFSLRGTIPPD